jgi:hypothetical protein
MRKIIMAADFITVNRTKPLGAALIEAADLTRRLREMVDKLSDAVGHSFAANDYTVMETNFGLSTGTGANAATLIALVQTILNSGTDVTGANRLAQLDEFCARLAGQ